MVYEDRQVIKAFRIYAALAAKGKLEKKECSMQMADESVRGLVEHFAREVNSTVIFAGEYMYLVPAAVSSIFHISNERIKKDYMSSGHSNADIYFMYIAIIILFGEFYDGYQTVNPTRDFITVEQWLQSMNERILSLKEHEEEQLAAMEKEHEYNWTAIINKWDSLNDIKEGVKKQGKRTDSRMSFLNMTKDFLEKQELITDLGEDQIELTEKAKTIVQRYYMDYEFNRGILDFMYKLEEKGD